MTNNTLKSVLREQMLRVLEAETEHYCTHKSCVNFLQMPNSFYVLPWFLYFFNQECILRYL